MRREGSWSKWGALALHSWGARASQLPPTPTSSTSAPECQETRDPGWEARKAARGLHEAGGLTLACLSSSWPSSLRFSWKEDPWDLKSMSSGEESNDPGGVARAVAGLMGHGAYPAWLSPRGTGWMALCSPHLLMVRALSSTLLAFL